jgi:hypothetical protein
MLADVDRAGSDGLTCYDVLNPVNSTRMQIFDGLRSGKAVGIGPRSKLDDSTIIAPNDQTDGGKRSNDSLLGAAETFQVASVARRNSSGFILRDHIITYIAG